MSSSVRASGLLLGSVGLAGQYAATFVARAAVVVAVGLVGGVRAAYRGGALLRASSSLSGRMASSWSVLGGKSSLLALLGRLSSFLSYAGAPVMGAALIGRVATSFRSAAGVQFKLPKSLFGVFGVATKFSGGATEVVPLSLTAGITSSFKAVAVKSAALRLYGIIKSIFSVRGQQTIYPQPIVTPETTVGYPYCPEATFPQDERAS